MRPARRRPVAPLNGDVPFEMIAQKGRVVGRSRRTPNVVDRRRPAASAYTIIQLARKRIEEAFGEAGGK